MPGVLQQQDAALVAGLDAVTGDVEQRDVARGLARVGPPGEERPPHLVVGRGRGSDAARQRQLRVDR